MTQYSRASGVTVTVNGPAKLASEPTPPKRGSGTAAKRVAAQAPDHDRLLLQSLTDQDLTLVDAIPLTIPTAARPKKRGATAPASSVALDVELGPDEHAVILLEDEGEYRWITDGKLLPAASPKRSAGKSVRAGKRRQRFSFDLEGAPPLPEIPAKRGGPKRRWFAKTLVGKAIAYVFRFVIKAVGKKLVARLEKKVEQGLVAITSPDPQKWQLLGDSARLPFTLPADRPARVLLFVHGTFSSTAGSFGALGIVPKGVDFLARAAAHYDAILGFDHVTLSVDPLNNAEQILDRLKRIKWPHPPHIEIVCFSRGALVARSLIEHLLPGTSWKATIGRVVFVGSTNGGTQLAEPDNWHRFIDHYTNLALGATRLLSAIPGAQGVGAVVGGVIRGVSILVKALATSAITDQMAPGLAAMEPDGKFVKTINKAQHGQPTAEQARYFAVTSDFQAKKALSTGGASELPPKLLLRIADWGADELYGEANDLVVHVRSMTEIDPGLGNFVKGKHDYGSNGVVYHTNYFAQETTSSRLIEWLDLGGLAPSGPAPKRGGTVRGVNAPGRPGKRAPIKPAPKKAAAKKVASRSERQTGTVRRIPEGVAVAETLPGWPHYPGLPRVKPLKEVLPKKPGGKPAPRVVTKKIVKKAAKKAAPKRGGTPAAAKKTMKKAAKKAASKRGRMPAAAKKTAKKAAKKSADRKENAVECYFRAEMDSEVVVNKTVTVDVTISRHALELARDRAGDTAATQVVPGKKLIVQIAPRRNFEVEGEPETEIDVPEPGGEATVRFNVKGLVPDSEGELWVQARQGAVPLVTLKLKPRIIAKAGTGPKLRLPAEGTIAEFAPSEAPIDELTIVESFVNGSVKYLYFLNLPSLEIKQSFESPEIERRDTYVLGLLNRIGNAWAGKKKSQIKAFERQLRAIGAEMFDKLMPLAMQSLLWSLRDKITGVQVSSMEPFIPWELVCLKEPGKAIDANSIFLGELGLTRWPYEGFPPARLRIRDKATRYVIPEYAGDMALPDAAREEQMMKNLFNAKRVNADAYDVQELLSKPGHFDLLHFAGHAQAASDELDDARLLLDEPDDGSTENALYATTVAQTAQLRDGKHRPIVVLNACESARQSRGFHGLGGFAPAFIRGGAGLFIGTLWSVGDTPALTFIDAFYRSFAVRKPNVAPR